MDLKKASNNELIALYNYVVQEMNRRGIFETDSTDVEVLDSLDECVMDETSESKSPKMKLKAISWGETEKINHSLIRDETADLISARIGEKFEKESQSRFVSLNRKYALFVMSSKYSERNREYWYSIDDDNLPWMELFNECYVAFAMGSSSHVLVFRFAEIKEMLKGCLRTAEDVSKNKRAHYHIAFAVEGKKHIYFKKKIPERSFVDVTDALLENLK